MQSRGWLRVHRLQFGFQDGIGCPEAIWVASELIDKYRRLKQPVTAILLDIQKAFDTTERVLVYERLLARGVPVHAVAVVQLLFDGCTFQVKLDGQISSAIDVLVGVFQGAVLSPFLFNIQIDDLPAGLCRTFGRVAPSLYGQPVPAQMFADDTSLYALSDDVAQRMLDYCEAYARQHRFAFNARKSQVTRDRRGATFTVNGDEIPDEADLASPTKFLGMVMRGGDFAHDAQLQDAPLSCAACNFIAAHKAGLIGSKVNVYEVDIATHKVLTGPHNGEDFYQINPKGNVPCIVLDDKTILNENAATLQ
ncbi:Reverse transcriptase domain-containing protein [Plasmodiophora brassicae]